MAKEKEEGKVSVKVTQDQDDIPLFYSDIMPLLVSYPSLIVVTMKKALLFFRINLRHEIYLMKLMEFKFKQS